MAKNIELKDEITLDEYKAWLTGMLRGKGTKLPDLTDWKAIKKMTDKIVPDVVEVQNPMLWPQPQPTPYTPPREYEWWETQPTCIGSGNIDNANNITITNGSSSVSMDKTGAMEINGDCSISIRDELLPDGVTIGYSDSECGGAYGSHIFGPYGCPPALDPTNHYLESATEEHLAQIAEVTGAKKSLQDYTWDTSKYVNPEEAELAPITELTYAQEMCIAVLDKKREK